MKLTCKVNQSEAIKHGFEPHSTVVIEFDINALTPDEREALATAYSSGEFKTGHTCHTIPTPDLAGLRSKLADLIAERDKHREASKQRIIEARRDFIERRTTDYHNAAGAWIIADANDQPVVSSTRPADHHGVSIRKQWSTLKPAEPFYSDAKEEFQRLLATPEGKAWLAKIDAENNRRRQAAIDEALDAFPAALAARNAQLEKAEADKRREQAADETLRGIIREHGTAMQNERMKRGLTDWPAEALDLMASLRIENPDGLAAFDRPHQYSTDTAEVITDDEMALVLRYETANPGATVTIETLDEDDIEPDAYGDPGDPGRHLRVDFTAEHGIQLVRLFYLD
jgi:hypothetical protein